MALGYLALAIAVLVFGAALAVVRGAKGVRAGRGGAAMARLKSPTVYLFTAYLVIAGLVSPTSKDESGSPLLGLALALPAAYALATLAAIGSPRPSPLTRAALGLVYTAFVLAAGAVVLDVASPAFVPGWLR